MRFSSMFSNFIDQLPLCQRWADVLPLKISATTITSAAMASIVHIDCPKLIKRRESMKKFKYQQTSGTTAEHEKGSCSSIIWEEQLLHSPSKTGDLGEKTETATQGAPARKRRRIRPRWPWLRRGSWSRICGPGASRKCSSSRGNLLSETAGREPYLEAEVRHPPFCFLGQRHPFLHQVRQLQPINSVPRKCL